MHENEISEKIISAAN